MALSPNLIYTTLLSNGLGGLPFQLSGPIFQDFAIGFATSFYAWVTAPSNVLVTGNSTGIIGTGSVTGTLAVQPNAGIIQSNLFSSAGAGAVSPSLSSIIANTVSQTVIQYSGIVSGVGIGQDISTISVANAGTLFALLSPIWTGPSGQGVLLGLSNGICAMLIGSVGSGAVLGTPVGISIASGNSISTVV